MSVLRSPGLRALLIAQAVSRLGSQMTFLALPWFVLETTGSASRMGVVLAVELAPIALFGIVSGSLVARLGARRTLMLGDVARVPILAAVPLLYEAGVLSFPVLLVLVFLAGCALAPYMSAATVVIPELVGNDQSTVAQANAAFEGVQRSTSLLGPPIAGLLIATIGASSVLYVDACTFLFSFVVVGLFVPKRPPLAPSEESRGVLAGVRFLLRDPFLRVLGITALFLNMFGQMLSASVLYLARADFDSAQIAGAFFAAYGGGAVVGSIAAMRLVKRHEPIRLGAVALLCMTAPLLLLGIDLPVPAVMLVLFVSSAFGPIINAPLIATIMTRSPEALRAKVMSAVITCALVAGPLGLLVVGPLLEDMGARSVLFLVAAGQLVATLPFVWIAFRKGMDAAPAAAPATSRT